MPEAIQRVVLPQILRFAMEAASFQRLYATELGRGKALVEVEDRWSAAQKTSARVELALDGRAAAPWRQKYPYRNRALGLCSSGGHQSLGGNILEAIRDVERTVADLEHGVP